MAAASDPVLIGLDWGTTQLRAALLDSAGGAHAVREREQGISRITTGAPGFAAAFNDTVGDWLRAFSDLPVLICGMAGSRQGWIEAPYAPCPAGPDDLARALIAAPGTERVFIVPGVSGRSPWGGPEVMRGEETQIVGTALADGWFVHPGTHSKWAVLERGLVTAFATFMTGELFEVLGRHSILGRSMASDGFAPDAFAGGVAAARAGGGLAHQLFSIRARGLLEDLSGVAQRSRLSGLLIGGEIAAMESELAGRPVTLIGAAHLTALYERALSQDGVTVEVKDGDTAAWRGLVRIARCAGLIGQEHDP